MGDIAYLVYTMITIKTLTYCIAQETGGGLIAPYVLVICSETKQRFVAKASDAMASFGLWLAWPRVACFLGLVDSLT